MISPPTLFLLKNFTNKLINVSSKKKRSQFFFQNHKVTSPFSYQSHYSFKHLFTIGTLRNYDPVKQYYILITYHDPTRPLFVPQETLIINEDFLLPYIFYSHIFLVLFLTFPQKMNKLVESPIEDHSRSLYTALAHKHYSLAQLDFIIAKLSSFILKKKRYKYFSLTSNISDEIIQSLPKHKHSSTISEPSTVPLLHSFIHPLLPTYSKLQTLMCVSIRSPALLRNFSAKFSLYFVPMLNSPRIPILSLFSIIFLQLTKHSNLCSNFIQLTLKI